MSNYREALNRLKTELDEIASATPDYKILAEVRAAEIERLQSRCGILEAELRETRKQLSQYAFIVGAARTVAAGFGAVTTPDEDKLYDLIEKYFLQVK